MHRVLFLRFRHSNSLFFRFCLSSLCNCSGPHRHNKRKQLSAQTTLSTQLRAQYEAEAAEAVRLRAELANTKDSLEAKVKALTLELVRLQNRLNAFDKSDWHRVRHIAENIVKGLTGKHARVPSRCLFVVWGLVSCPNESNNDCWVHQCGASNFVDSHVACIPA
jgi:hypothetical protein